MSQEFYVPTFVGFADSLGNTQQFTDVDATIRGSDLSTDSHKRLYVGDVLTIDVQVDPSFEETTYEIDWYIKTSPEIYGTGKQAVVEITSDQISRRMEIMFKLRTNNAWHRTASGIDDYLELYYRVPPSS